jgi:hypothetical protein
MGYFSFFSKESLLDLKKKISNKKYTIYLETTSIEDKSNVKYQLRKSYYLREELEYDFDEYIQGNTKNLSVSFLSLNGKTCLVIPTKGYLNINDFAKKATDREWLALFRKTGKLVKKGDHLSTHGHGVSWLHMRIEKIPEHYEPSRVQHSSRNSQQK